MRIIRHSSLAAVPWKNGGGVTHEAIRVPPEAGPFDWRVSVARIDTSGPFSDFAGYDRFMVLLKGAGVVLKFADPSAPRVSELRGVGDMLEFDGALAAHCDLVQGPCVDLNLMVSQRLGGVRARVETLREARYFDVGTDDTLLLFPIDAGVELSRGETEPRDQGALRDQLGPWDLAVLSGREERQVRVAAIGGEGGNGVAMNLFLAILPSGAGW
jgi:environmental stress-induced protein Ves